MSDSSGMVHQWVYVIVPTGPEMRPYMCAFCKVCRNYFTEPIARLESWMMVKSHMPKLGCTMPEDGIIV